MAYYYPGSTYDRQSRIAQSSANYDQVHGTPRPLLGKDALPVGQTTLDTRRPPFYLSRQQRIAQQSQNDDQVHDTPLALRGKDALPPGQSTYDSRRPFSFIRPPYRLAVYDANSINGILPLMVAVSGPPFAANAPLPPRAAPRVVDLLTFFDPSEVWLFGTDSMLVGKQLTDALPPRRAPRSVDLLTFTDPSEMWLFGTDALNAGAQSFELSPRTAARSRDYSWSQELIPNLIGQDATTTGTQSVALPPTGPLRARDYSFAPSINLCCLTSIAPPFVQTTASTELPPRAAARSRDYTFLDSSEFWLFGTDALVTGQQSTVLPTPPRARAATLPDPGVNLTVWLYLASQAVQGPGQSTANTELPPRAYARSRDYTLAEAFPLVLIGQDATTAGEQSTALPSYAPRRASQLSDPGVNLAIAITTVALPTGQQFTDLPPKSAQRARDYTHLDQTRRQLIGQDAMVTGQNADRTALPPKAAPRARDYTWLQTYPLYIYEQRPVGDSTSLTESPPRGPLRLRDYTHLDLTKRNLIGKDVVHGAPGQVPTYDWQLPTPAPKRLRDYTHFDRFSLPELVSRTRPGKHTLTDRALFLHTLSDRALFEHSLSDRSLYVHTDTDSVAVE